MALEAKIRARIDADGPIGVDAFMEMCLADPEHGYYRAQPAIGAAGDFITAPEISQIFGELIGLWLAQSWVEQGAPTRMSLVELGPGRGVLMADAVRAAKAAPGFLDAAELWLVETSPRLRAQQSARLSMRAPRFAETIEELPNAPIFLIANEFFDALPIRQFQNTDAGWRERRVGAAEDALRFELSPAPEDSGDFPDAPRDAWIERAPAADHAMSEIASRIASQGGAALIIDYGYAAPERAGAGWPETLQALTSHRMVDPLKAAAGRADLTAHVNFSDLARMAAGCDRWGPVPQGAWLRRLGADIRAAALAQATPDRAAEILAGHKRLTRSDQMGALFRVFAVTPRGAPAPAGFAREERWRQEAAA